MLSAVQSCRPAPGDGCSALQRWCGTIEDKDGPDAVEEQPAHGTIVSLRRVGILISSSVARQASLNGIRAECTPAYTPEEAQNVCVS